MSKIFIKIAKPDDADALTKIAFAAKAYWGYDAEFMAACVDELRVTSAILSDKNQSHYVAVQDGTIIGFYGLEKLSATEFELDSLFVRPELIGKGIGRRLMKHAKQIAQQMGCKIMTIQSEPNAEAFYQAAGGKTVGQKASDSIAGRYLPMLEIRFD